MQFKPNKEEDWREYVANNDDMYGSGVIRFAQTWAELMEAQMPQGFDPKIADTTCTEADTEGITGAMYGFAVAILNDVWKWGDELKKWHNKVWGNEQAEGVINPAVIQF